MSHTVVCLLRSGAVTSLALTVFSPLRLPSGVALRGPLLRRGGLLVISLVHPTVLVVLAFSLGPVFLAPGRRVTSSLALGILFFVVELALAEIALVGTHISRPLPEPVQGQVNGGRVLAVLLREEALLYEVVLLLVEGELGHGLGHGRGRGRGLVAAAPAVLPLQPLLLVGPRRRLPLRAGPVEAVVVVALAVVAFAVQAGPGVEAVGEVAVLVRGGLPVLAAVEVAGVAILMYGLASVWVRVEFVVVRAGRRMSATAVDRLEASGLGYKAYPRQIQQNECEQ